MGEYHGLTALYEEVAHVPLIIRFADKLGLKNGIKIDALTQTPDITATVLELADVGKPDEVNIQGGSVVPLVKGEKSKLRDIAVSTPSLMRSVWAGLRATITTDEWALILAPEASIGGETEKAEVTLIVDGEPRVLKPFGRITTELYNIKSDPKQQENVIAENRDIAEYLRKRFLEFLTYLNASGNAVKPWLKCVGLD
jgi:arylsulfatase A-like enzyme